MARARMVLPLAALLFGCGLSKGGTGGGPSPDDARPDAVDLGVLESSVDGPVDVPDASDVLDGDVLPDGDAGPCKIVGGADLCAEIPRFSAAKQIVDGIGDEFCDLKATVFDATKGALMVPAPPPSGTKGKVSARFAWSDAALHAHLAVEDDDIVVADDGDFVWRADSVEVYVAGYASLTGTFDGVSDKGAMQIVVAPPGGGKPARAQIFLDVTYAGTLDGSKFAVRLVPGGYEVELRLPWADLMGAPKPAATIALDVALSQLGSGSGSARFWSVYKLQPPGTLSCGEPSCDDLLWCTPKLK